VELNLWNFCSVLLSLILLRRGGDPVLGQPAVHEIYHNVTVFQAVPSFLHLEKETKKDVSFREVVRQYM
jgi:hypothetical protein